MGWEHEMVKLMAGLVMDESPKVMVVNVAGVKTWMDNVVGA